MNELYPINSNMYHRYGENTKVTACGLDTTDATKWSLHYYYDHMLDTCSKCFSNENKEKLVELQSKLPSRQTQVGGTHYVNKKIQPWDVWADNPDMDPFTASIIKYMMRWRSKNGLQDLKKAAHTLQALIEIQEGNHGS